MQNATCLNSDGNILYKLYQWDSGVDIKIDVCDHTFITGVTKVDFSNIKTPKSLSVNAIANGSMVSVKIPDLLLRDAHPLIIHVRTNKPDSLIRTVAELEIPVVYRKQPEDYIFNDCHSNGEITDKLTIIEKKIDSIENSGISMTYI